MFGDAGHGLLMTLFAAWMVLKEKGLAAERTDNEVVFIRFHLQKLCFIYFFKN